MMKHAWMTALLLGANLAVLALFGVQRLEPTPLKVAPPQLASAPSCASSEPKVYEVEMPPEVFIAHASEPLTQVDSQLVDPQEAN